MIPPPFPAAARAAVRDAAKAGLRNASGAEDALIEQFAGVALGLAEAFTGSALIVRDWVETVPAAPCWQRLTMAPVLAIGTVEGLPAEGAAFALASDAYAIDIDAASEGWVRVTQPGAAGRVRVTYSAGMAESFDALPEPLAQGVVLLTAHLFEARPPDAAPPAAVGALWRPWRRTRLSGGTR